MTNDKDQLALELAGAIYLIESVVRNSYLAAAIMGFALRVMQAEARGDMGRLPNVNFDKLSDAATALALVVRSCLEIDDVLILAAKRFLQAAEEAIG